MKEIKCWIFLIICAFICSSTCCFSTQRKLHFINTNVSRCNTNFLMRKKKEIAKNLVSPIKGSSTETPFSLEKIKSDILLVGRKLIKRPLLFKMTTVVLMLGGFVGLFIYKKSQGDKKEQDQSPSPNETAQLFKYKCEKCNLVMFPAKGREKKFLKQNDICPNCGNSHMSKVIIHK